MGAALHLKRGSTATELYLRFGASHAHLPRASLMRREIPIVATLNSSLAVSSALLSNTAFLNTKLECTYMYLVQQ